jgi:cytochrome P450
MTPGTTVDDGSLRDAVARDALVPPAPEPPEQVPGLHRVLRQFGENAILVWPAEAYREDVVVRDLPGRRVILVNDPAFIRRIFVDDAARYQLPHPVARSLAPILRERSLLLAEGEAWRNARRSSTHCFSKPALERYARDMVALIDRTLDGLAARPGQPCSLLPVLEGLTLKIAGRALFSKDLEPFTPEIEGFRHEYFEQIGAGPTILDLLLPRWLPSPKELARRRLGRRWLDLVDRLMDSPDVAVAQDGAGNLLDAFRSIVGPATGRPIDRSHLRDHVAGMVLVGHETTALALFWSCYLLAPAPSVQALVAGNAAATPIDPATPTASLPRLTMVRALIDETLRLYPPAHVVVRQATAPTPDGPIPIPKGTLILLAPWVLHRHHRPWREPALFDPTRFLPDAPPIDRFAHLPFGVGPRTCLDAQFALMEATLVLSRLLHRFRVELYDSAEPQPVATVTTRPEPAPRFRLATP